MTASESALPGLNLTTVLAAILIVAPVAGFLPSLAALSEVEKVPKPTNAALSLAFKVFSIESNTDCTASVACPCVIPAESATT